MKTPLKPPDVLTDDALLERFDTFLQNLAVPREKRREVVNRASVRRVEAESVLFRAGDRLESLFFVLSGLVRFYYLTPDGKEFNKSFATDGSFVTCLSSFLEDRPSRFFTQALETTVLVALPMDLIRDLKAKDIVWERLVSMFVTRLALQKEQREASFLLDSASDRYEAFLTDFKTIAPRLPQYHIASFLGITPVALSRIRARRTARSS